MTTLRFECDSHDNREAVRWFMGGWWCWECLDKLAKTWRYVFGDEKA